MEGTHFYAYPGFTSVSVSLGYSSVESSMAFFPFPLHWWCGSCFWQNVRRLWLSARAVSPQSQMESEGSPCSSNLTSDEYLSPGECKQLGRVLNPFGLLTLGWTFSLMPHIYQPGWGCGYGLSLVTGLLPA